jgi:hypothetical protein
MAAPTLNPTSIRQDMVTRLTGKTAAISSVFDTRKVGWLPAQLPALSVSTIGSNNSRDNLGSTMHTHTESVVVSGDVTGNSETEVAAALDSLEAEIEDALMCDDEWMGAFETVEGPDVRKEISVDGSRLIGSVHMKFDLRYRIFYERKSPEPGDLEHLFVTVEPTDPVGANVSRRDLLGDPELAPEDENE